MKRIWHFIEDTVTTIPRRYDIEDIRRSIEHTKQQLLLEIEESRNTVKFDLLHDSSPQVNQLKVLPLSLEQENDHFVAVLYPTTGRRTNKA